MAQYRQVIRTLSCIKYWQHVVGQYWPSTGCRCTVLPVQAITDLMLDRYRHVDWVMYNMLTTFNFRTKHKKVIIMPTGLGMVRGMDQKWKDVPSMFFVGEGGGGEFSEHKLCTTC